MVSFDADVGFLLSALVKPDKKSLALPDVMTLSGPSGAIDISAGGVGRPRRRDVFLELFTESPQQGVGVDAVVWELLLRAGTTSVQLPPTALPMFGAGSAWEACVGSKVFKVFEGFVFDYDAIFDADIGDIDATIDGQSDAFCESFAITEFTVD